MIARRAQAEAVRRRHARGGAAKAAPLEDGVTAVAGADLIDGVFDPLALAATGVGEVWRIGVGGVFQAAAADADQAKTSAVKLDPQQRL